MHNYQGCRKDGAADTLLSGRSTRGGGTCQEEGVATDRVLQAGVLHNCEGGRWRGLKAAVRREELARGQYDQDMCRPECCFTGVC